MEFEILAIYVIAMRRALSATRNRGSVSRPHEREIVFTEHLNYRWVNAADAAALTKSWSNRQAIEEFVINAA